MKYIQAPSSFLKISRDREKVHLLALLSVLPALSVQFSFISDSKQQKRRYLTAPERNGVLKPKRSKGFVPPLSSPRVFCFPENSN